MKEVLIAKGLSENCSILVCLEINNKISRLLGRAFPLRDGKSKLIDIYFINYADNYSISEVKNIVANLLDYFN